MHNVIIERRKMSEYDLEDDSLDLDDDVLDRDSDEDTEDASETDMVRQEEEYTEIKDQMYQDKLYNLKKQLQQLKDEVHPEYVRRLRKLEMICQDRLLLNEVFQGYEIERVEREYLNEKKSAVREFEEKKIELRENLILELDDKKRIIEAERCTMELTGDSMEVKPVTTRKLRRRPNDPLPLPEKRRKTSPTQLNYLLDECEVMEDLKYLNRGKFSSQSKRLETLPDFSFFEGMSMHSNVDVRIEEGKLLYDKKWFHRGQSIYLESKETGRFSGVISQVGTTDVWIKKVSDSSKIKIYLNQLHRGKFVIRKRSN